MSCCARSCIRMWKRGNRTRCSLSWRGILDNGICPTSSVIYLLPVKYFCRFPWALEAAQNDDVANQEVWKSKTAYVQQLTTPTLSGHIHINLQSKLFSFFHQGFCVVIHAKGLKNNQFTRILFRKDFYCFLPFPSLGQEWVYLHGRFRVIAHILNSCLSLAPLSFPSTVLLHLTKTTDLLCTTHHWNISLLSNPFPDVLQISGQIWLSPRRWLQGRYPRKLQSKT